MLPCTHHAFLFLRALFNPQQHCNVKGRFVLLSLFWEMVSTCVIVGDLCVSEAYPRRMKGILKANAEFIWSDLTLSEPLRFRDNSGFSFLIKWYQPLHQNIDKTDEHCFIDSGLLCQLSAFENSLLLPPCFCSDCSGSLPRLCWRTWIICYLSF